MKLNQVINLKNWHERKLQVGYETRDKVVLKQSKKGKELMGGIAIYVNGTWRYNDSEKYEYDPKDLSKWKVLDL